VIAIKNIKRSLMKASAVFSVVMILVTMTNATENGYTISKKFVVVPSYGYDIKWQNDDEPGIANGIASDSDSNIISVGTIGDETNSSAYIVKYDQDGNKLWGHTQDAMSLDQLEVETNEETPKANDTEEQMWVPISYINKLLERTHVQIPINLSSPWLILWRSSTFMDVQVDPSGNIVATGFYTSWIINTTNERGLPVAWDTIVAKYSPDGVVEWEKRYSYAMVDMGWSLDISDEGMIFVAAHGFKIYSIDPWTWGMRDTKIFVLKISPSSGLCVQKTVYIASGPNGEKTYPLTPHIKIDGATGRPWVAGELSGPGGYLDNDTDQDIFIVSFEQDGGKYLEWQYDSGAGMFENVRALIVDQNEILISGLKGIDNGDDFPTNPRAYFLRYSTQGDFVKSFEVTSIEYFSDVCLRHSVSGQKQLVGIHQKNSKAFIGIYTYENGAKILEINDPNIGAGEMHKGTVTPAQDIAISGEAYGWFTTIYYHIEEICMSLSQESHMNEMDGDAI